MPVMVVGTDNVIARRAVQLLVPGGGEVRVFVRAADPTGTATDIPVDPERFRAMGCKVAHGFLDDEAHLETALEQVHTVLLLLGRPLDDPDTYLDRAATVISAAIGADCRRVVLLSDLAVADPKGNPWLLALAEAEEMVADAPMESVVIRAALTYGAEDALTLAVAQGALGQAPSGSHWPVQADEVAMAAVLADAERELDSSLHVVIDVAGPAGMSTVAIAGHLARALHDDHEAPPATLPDHVVDLLTRTIDRPAAALGEHGADLADFDRPAGESA